MNTIIDHLRFVLLSVAMAFLILPYAGPVPVFAQSTFDIDVGTLHKTADDSHSTLLEKAEIKQAIMQERTKQLDKITREVENPDYSGGGVAFGSIGGASASCAPLTADSPKKVGQDVVGTSGGTCTISNAPNARVEWYISTAISWKGKSGRWYIKSTDSEYPTGQSITWQGGNCSADDNCKVGSWITTVFVSVRDLNNPDEKFGLTKEEPNGYWSVNDAISASTTISSCDQPTTVRVR